MGKTRERKCVLTDQAALIVESGMAAQFLSSKGRFQYCKLTGQSLKMYRICLDCPYAPVLCQTAQRDCHIMWHEPSFDNISDLWFKSKEASNQQLQVSDEPKRGCGRPKGSKKCCGN